MKTKYFFLFVSIVGLIIACGPEQHSGGTGNSDQSKNDQSFKGQNTHKSPIKIGKKGSDKVTGNEDSINNIQDNSLPQGNGNELKNKQQKPKNKASKNNDISSDSDQSVDISNTQDQKPKNKASKNNDSSSDSEDEDYWTKQRLEFFKSQGATKEQAEILNSAGFSKHKRISKSVLAYTSYLQEYYTTKKEMFEALLSSISSRKYNTEEKIILSSNYLNVIKKHKLDPLDSQTLHLACCINQGATKKQAEILIETGFNEFSTIDKSILDYLDYIDQYYLKINTRRTPDYRDKWKTIHQYRKFIKLIKLKGRDPLCEHSVEYLVKDFKKIMKEEGVNKKQAMVLRLSEYPGYLVDQTILDYIDYIIDYFGEEKAYENSKYQYEIIENNFKYLNIIKKYKLNPFSFPKIKYNSLTQQGATPDQAIILIEAGYTKSDNIDKLTCAYAQYISDYYYQSFDLFKSKIEEYTKKLIKEQKSYLNTIKKQKYDPLSDHREVLPCLKKGATVDQANFF